MNYLYIPELDNFALNMDQIKQVWFDRDGDLQYISITDKNRFHKVPPNKLQAVKDRLDIFFLNKGPAV